jgi:hypothetical protein
MKKTKSTKTKDPTKEAVDEVNSIAESLLEELPKNINENRYYVIIIKGDKLIKVDKCLIVKEKQRLIGLIKSRKGIEERVTRLKNEDYKVRARVSDTFKNPSLECLPVVFRKKEIEGLKERILKDDEESE